MDADSQNEGWKDVPSVAVGRWRELFDLSREGLNLSAACPVCGATRLHRWFDLNRAEPSWEFGRTWIGRGSQWQWCSSCRSYEHTSGLVPDWWFSDLPVSPESLRHDPGPVEEVRSASSGS